MSKEVKVSVIVARRLLASVVIVPAVAAIYLFGYISLVALGAGSSATLSELVANGILIGVVASLVFALSAISKK